jgi:hypothetical protein
MIMMELVITAYNIPTVYSIFSPLEYISIFSFIPRGILGFSLQVWAGLVRIHELQ